MSAEKISSVKRGKVSKMQPEKQRSRKYLTS